MSVRLVGFSDASVKAYAAVEFVNTIMAHNRTRITCSILYNSWGKDRFQSLNHVANWPDQRIKLLTPGT